MFDLTDGWEGSPPAGGHIVVVPHRPKPEGWSPGAPYHFVDDVTRAVATAREPAGDRAVVVSAGDVGGQAFALGLVEEVAMDVVPAVFGSGRRYFGPARAPLLLEDPYRVVQGDRVPHLRHRVRRQRAGDRARRAVRRLLTAWRRSSASTRGRRRRRGCPRRCS